MKARTFILLAAILTLALGGVADAKAKKKRVRGGGGTTGESQLVDDGTCPPGQIKLVTNGGGSTGKAKNAPRNVMCVPKN